MLRLGENILYELSTVRVVVRIARNAQHLDDARKEIAVAGWLASQGFPAAQVFDVGCEQPIQIDDYPVTFWRFLSGRSANVNEAGMLGGLLRRLHHLGRPAIDLPPVRPFGHVCARLESAPIPDADNELLLRCVADLENRLASVRFQLPEVAVHGDAHVKNLMIAEDSAVLIDFEAFAWGPAEWDLAKTATEASMGMIGVQDYRAFVDAYCHDVTTWSGWPVLRGIQQVRMVTWLAQNIDHSPRIRAEYCKRIATIRTGVFVEPWSGF